MRLQIKVDDDGKISDVKFKTFGCGSAIASSSYLTELVRGMTLEQAGKIKNTEIAKELCLPPVKLHCSMLAEDAIKSAIKDYNRKSEKSTCPSNSCYVTNVCPDPRAKVTDLGAASASMPRIEIEKVSSATA